MVVALVLVLTQARLPAPLHPERPADGLRPADRPATNANGRVMVAAYNLNEVDAIRDRLSGYMVAGDGVALVVGSNDSTRANSWLSDLTPTLSPSSYTYRAYWGLDGVNSTPGISNLSSTFTQVSADWEVHGPSEFKANPFCTPWGPAGSVSMTTCQFFSSLDYRVNASSRTSVAYVTGQGLFGDYVKYHWDYGTIASIVGAETVETQGYAHDFTQWQSALNKLTSQFSNHSQPLSKLSVQVSLGAGGNGVNVSDAVAAIDYAYSVGIPEVFLWYTQTTETWASSVLSKIDRTMPMGGGGGSTPVVPPAPTGLAASNVGSTFGLLSWTNPGGSNLTIATLYLDGNGGGECGNWTILAYVTQPASSAYLTNLTQGTGYCVFVTVTNASGESAFSNEANFTTPSIYAGPGGLPVTGTGGTTGNSSVVLTDPTTWGWTPLLVGEGAAVIVGVALIIAAPLRFKLVGAVLVGLVAGLWAGLPA